MAGTLIIPTLFQQAGESFASLTVSGAISGGSLTLSSALAAIYGGTGQTGYAVGDLLYASTTTALSKLADVATGSVIVSGGVGVAPAWSSALTLAGALTLTLATGNSLVVDTTTLVVDATNHRVAIGSATATQPLTLVGTISQVRIGADTTDTGAYLLGQANGNLHIGGNAAWNGSAWIAKGTTASLWTFGGTSLSYYLNSGLTIGNSFTPTRVFTLSTTQLLAGPTADTNPAFGVNWTSSTVTGLVITSAVAASGLAMVVRSSGTDESLTLNAKGAGSITLQGVSTGSVNIGSKLGVSSTITAPVSMLEVAETNGGAVRGITCGQYGSSTNAAQFLFRKARGTLGVPTVITTGDTLSQIVSEGYDGTAYLQMADLAVVATGTIGTGRVPTKMLFYTATDAATSVLTLALTLNANQTAVFTAGVTGTTFGGTGILTALSGTAPVAAGSQALALNNTASFGVYTGTGAPTVSAAQGSIYIRRDGTGAADRAYINTNGSTTWTAIVTVA